MWELSLRPGSSAQTAIAVISSFQSSHLKSSSSNVSIETFIRSLFHHLDDKLINSFSVKMLVLCLLSLLGLTLADNGVIQLQINLKTIPVIYLFEKIVMFLHMWLEVDGAFLLIPCCHLTIVWPLTSHSFLFLLTSENSGCDMRRVQWSGWREDFIFLSPEWQD